MYSTPFLCGQRRMCQSLQHRSCRKHDRSELTDRKNTDQCEVRVQEMSDGTVEVQQYVSQKNKDTGANEWVWKSVAKSTDSSQPAGTSVYKLSSYSVAISSNYKALNQAEVYYELTLTAELEAHEKCRRRLFLHTETSGCGKSNCR